MVESRSQRVALFAAFVLPCLVLYTVFFIVPFVNGLYISLTNWDGLSPRSPIRMERLAFERDILSKVSSDRSRRYLLSVYALDSAGEAYERLSLGVIDRWRVESIVSLAGWAPERNRFVGAKNYADILRGQVSEAFYPRSYQKRFYSATSLLPPTIEAADATRNLLPKLDERERETFGRFYALEPAGAGGNAGGRGNAQTGKQWRLRAEFGEFGFEDLIWRIAEVDSPEATVSTEAVETFLQAIRAATLARDRPAFDSAVAGFTGVGTKRALISAASARSVGEGAEGLWRLGEIKNVLASKWYAPGFDLGVVGYTAFFALFSVIGINLLAFALALALDSGIKGQKILRSVFFIPNVLSMVIVALIWKMLFTQMLPRLTGIEQWLSDSAKTPWLIVLVAVWQGAGYYMIVYLAGLQNVPVDVVEAARIDGAGPLQRFVNVTLPLLLPAITVSLFLTVANALKSFDLVYALTSGSAYTWGTVPFVLDIFFDAFARKQAGLATAKAMLLFGAILLITGAQLFVMKRKEVEQ